MGPRQSRLPGRQPVALHVRPHGPRGDLDDPDGWAGRWLRFGRDRHPERAPPPSVRDDPDALSQWVAEVVLAFCAAHAFRDRYQAATRGAS